MKMKGIILGGGTFIGYWMKQKITMEFGCAPIILDLPRENTRLLLNENDKFYPLYGINFKVLENYKPEYVVFNFYDLFDIYSLEPNKNHINIIMSTINNLMDLVDRLNCKLIVVAHINRYYKTKNFYQSMFNNLNDTYLLYLEVLARAKLMNTQILLLPTVFGPMESEKSIISTILKKVENKEELILPNTKRDFLYVESVIDYCFSSKIFEHKNGVYKQYCYLSSGKELSIVEMYTMISGILGKKSTFTLSNERCLLEPGEFNSNLIENIIIEQKYSEELNRYFQSDLNHWRKETSTVDLTGGTYSLEVGGRVTVLSK
jgi:nucleoside-diphosphate-sugar epimerase